MKFKELKEKFQTYLCPPGDGVYTVHTGRDKKERYQKALYGTDGDEVKEKWSQALSKITGENNQLFLFGITSDTGGGIQRGANWGPLFIRETYLQKYGKTEFIDLGDTRTIPHLLHDKYLNKETIISCQKALYGESDNYLPVSPLSIAEDFAKEFFRNFPKNKLITLGGDHSVSYPMVYSWIKARTSQKKKVAIIHFDAHTDLMDQRLGIDICFGTWARHIIELLDSPKDLIQLGIRSSGRDRGHWEDNLGIQQIWASEIKEKGVQYTINHIQSYLADLYDEIYISFDIDALDISFASATGTPESDGLDLHEAIVMLKSFLKTYNVTGADIVEVAPFVGDSSGQKRTLDSACYLLKTLSEGMK